MKLFCAANYKAFQRTLSKLAQWNVDKPSETHFLFSYAQGKFDLDSFIGLCGQHGFTGKCILDSGAFSVITLGTRISLQEYGGWLKAQRVTQRPEVQFYSNLDVIGDADKTWRNQQVMELEGLSPRPVIHHGYTDAQIERVIDRHQDFSIGGLVPLLKGSTRPLVTQFLDRIFNAAFKRWPTPCIHGFGVSVYSLIKRYPFDSVDSSTWLTGVRYSRVVLFDEVRAKLVTVPIRDPAQLCKMPGVIQQYGLTTKRVLELFAGDRYELQYNISALGLLSNWRMMRHVNRLHRTRKDCSQ